MMEANSIDFLPNALHMRKADAAAGVLPADTSYAMIGLLVERNHDQPFTKGSPNQKTAFVSVGGDTLRVADETGATVAEQRAKAVHVTMEDSRYVLHARDKKFKIIDMMAIEPSAPFDTRLTTYQNGIEPLFTLLESKGATVQRVTHTYNRARRKMLLILGLCAVSLPLAVLSIMLLVN